MSYISRNTTNNRSQGNGTRAANESAPVVGGGGTERDAQIVALLNQIGERLVRSEKERIALQGTLRHYDALFAEMESRTTGSEKEFQTLKNQIAQREQIERTLRTRQEKIEQVQKAQAEKILRAEALSNRIEEALTQNARIVRRLEKITQDRARMIRKLERIEETVIETREALNAKAMVLLTEQGTAAQTGAPFLPAAAEAQNASAATATAEKTLADIFKPAPSSVRWGEPIYLQAASIAALVLLAVFSAWAVTRMPAPTEQTVAETTAPIVETETADLDNIAPPPLTMTEEPIEDVTTVTDEAMNNAFAENPDKLASALNKIEPGSLPSPTAPAQKATPPAESERTVKAEEAKPQAQEARTVEKTSALPPPSPPQEVGLVEAMPPQPVEITEAGSDQFIAAQADKAPLADRIKPDPALPPVVKGIENKAFEGVPEAQHDLAAIYTAGHAGVTVNYTKAAQWFREAAVQGVANARYNLGVLHQQGLGVEKNINTAVGWYRAAAELGHPEAEYNLGISYIEGAGAPYDPAQAAAYFEKAAKGGIVEASYNLGLIYENGLLGAPDLPEAMAWYRKAADKGNADAKAAIRQLEKNFGRIEPAAAAPEKTKAAASPPAVSPSLRREHAIVSQIQEQLMRAGLYPGPADGITGPQTEDAIRTWQVSNDMEPDGRATEELLEQMMAAENPSMDDQSLLPVATAAPGSLRAEDMVVPESSQN